MTVQQDQVDQLQKELAALKEHTALLYDVPISLIVFLSIAYGAVALAAIIGNSVVLWGFITSDSTTPFDRIRLRKVTNMFIVNLAIADILIGAFAIPFQFIAALLQRWILPNFMCPFCTFVQIVSVNVSIFTLVAIAADRFLIVEKPLLQITKKRAKQIILIIWITAILVALPAAIALKVDLVPDISEKVKIKLESIEANMTYYALKFIPMKDNCDNYTLNPEIWKFYNRCLVFIQYVFPVSVIIFLYGKMGLKLADGTKSSEPERPSERFPSFREESNDHRSPSEFELSTHSRQHSSSLRANDSNVIYNKDGRTASITTNAEYIATHKRRVLKMLLIVVALFAFCWLPLQTYNLLQYFVPAITAYPYINVIWFVCHFLAMLNSCLNPFVYAIHTVSS